MRHMTGGNDATESPRVPGRRRVVERCAAYQERWGYPALTEASRRKILGLNSAGLPGLGLELQEHLLVADVGRDRHDLGVAQTHQLGVDHQVADPDIGEQTPVAVALLHVELEPDGLAFDQPAVDLGRLAAPRLLALSRVMDLGRVDADVADLLDAGADPHVDRVAVDDAHDGAFHWSGYRPRGERSDEREQPTAERADNRHALTVSPPASGCQSLDTLQMSATG